MTIAFSCPHCGKSLKVKDELAGKKIKCPGCQALATVPTAEEEDTAAYAVATQVDTKTPSVEEQGLAATLDDAGSPRSRKGKKKAAPSRGALKLLALLSGGALLLSCCVAAALGGWLYFFHFTGHELVGTWENDRSASGTQAYVRARFDRTGHITLAEPKRMMAGLGTWRVLSKKDNVYTLEIANPDGKLKARAEITMLSDDRMRFVCAELGLNVELTRLE
jgi:hypothetical protein